jgi:2-polyprenyl-3-methyl-5-hydroxy-6-metoxy-1,4-benzoquinol methylase
MSDSKSLWLKVQGGMLDNRITLGRASSNAYATDPKMIGFMAARYKFVAKMLEGCSSALEVGCGDGFGAPVVAQAVDRLYCTDIDESTLEDNANRLSFVDNLGFEYYDFRERRFHTQVDAAYCVDVIEHIFPSEESTFLKNIELSVAQNGIAIFGTPNKTAEQFASENSRDGHINLKDHKTLRTLMLQHFHRVFIFSMNDEVLHTGYYPMAHYLWALCVDPILHRHISRS